MSPEQQRIAIAESVGWSGVVGSPSFVGYPPGTQGRGKRRILPDFCGDLNAMHGAEKALSGMKPADYNAQLFLVIEGMDLSRGIHRPQTIFKVINATAAQRAEAYLRTIGRWQDEKDKG